MKVAAITCNLGSYDRPVSWVEQIVPEHVELTIRHYNDANFPIRTKAMTARLQCAMPKFFAWQDQFVPDQDFYVWLDASSSFTNSNAVWWFVEQCLYSDLVICKHPARKTLQEEYEFVSRKLKEGNAYLTSRYSGEWLDEQWDEIKRGGLEMAPLYASTMLCYRNIPRVHTMMKNWWYQKTRYELHDQIGLTWALNQGSNDGNVQVNALDVNIYNNPWFANVRKRATNA